LTLQSGSSRILEIMNRGYTREWYIQKVDRIREILGPDCGISSDMITGFCSETEEEHQETLSLMDYVQYDFAYMFYYSERPGTLAEKKFKDDISLDVKKRRLDEIIKKQRGHSSVKNNLDIGKQFKVLVEGFSKKSDNYLQGRNSANKVIVFPREHFKTGEYVNVLVQDCTGGTLLGKAIY
jgi:tRNA-2-methylthio-N6-dimethylallyladenosine synthase